MTGEIYEFESGTGFREFEFDSIGPKGVIKKVVQYSETNLKDLYNLGFGDKDDSTNKINDLAVTNNGDSQKVLATVASTLLLFTQYFPDASVIAVGATLARTRLYRIGITNNLEAIERSFYIYGLKNNKWHRFAKNTTYDAFLVTRKR
jgi:hypothetical protein